MLTVVCAIPVTVCINVHLRRVIEAKQRLQQRLLAKRAELATRVHGMYAAKRRDATALLQAGRRDMASTNHYPPRYSV